MKVKEKQIYNLMDTNGRRNDVSNALKGYLIILDDIFNNKCDSWNNLPKSLSQYFFYCAAITMFPDVFAEHKPYDEVKKIIDENPDIKNAIENNDIDWIREHYTEKSDIFTKFDTGIEDRARHYTSNLVKIGFTDEKRKISDAGKCILNTKLVKRDILEQTLPIDDTNLVYLRQLLKLKIFDKDMTKFYSPFCMAIYILLKKKRVTDVEFFSIIQSLNPYYDYSNIENSIDNFEDDFIAKSLNINIPDELNNNEILSKDRFYELFYNGKNRDTIDVYWNFYSLLYVFYNNKTQDNFDSLINYFTENKKIINKAFGAGNSFFVVKKDALSSIDVFIEKNSSIFNTDKINNRLYYLFVLSKYIDGISEYSDTTKRIFKLSGIISFDNGYVELAYKELCEEIFDINVLAKLIYGEYVADKYENYSGYENGAYSYYGANITVSEIFEYSAEKLSELKLKVCSKFDGNTINDIAKIISEKRKIEFNEFINNNYPPEKVKELLTLISDRTNDNKIKEIVSEDASVPTIYEYIVGIAWYYFSNKTIDLLSSYNLSLSANFEPLVHAGGGDGDIVIYSNNNVVMLEATLMNTNSQKRGEWEPVLRHSVNLKVKEEQEKSNRLVTSFFIADEFDTNTINIWKAVAAVPLESSLEKGVFTDNVVIMPINNSELCTLIDNSNKYNEIIQKVHKIFEVDNPTFDMKWRDKFISEIFV